MVVAGKNLPLHLIAVAQWWQSQFLTPMGNLKKKRRLKMNKHKRRKRSKAHRHKKRLWG